MKFRSMLLPAVLFTVLFTTGLSAQQQTKGPILQFQLDNGTTVYGRIIKTEEATVTISSIWNRNIVVFRDDISEIAQTEKTREQLFNELQLYILDREESLFTGKVLAATNDTLQFETSGGIQIAIPQNKIKQISTKSPHPPAQKDIFEEEKLKAGYWTQSSLFLTPTGYQPQKGDLYLSMFYVFIPTLTFGIHENFSFSGGISLIPGAREQMYVLSPRVGLYQGENAALSVSYVMFGATGGDDVLQFFHASGSVGSENFRGTFGLGAGVSHGDLLDTPVITLGLDFKLSESAHFIAEGLFVNERDLNGLLLIGFRFMGEHVSGDIALWTVPELLGDDGLSLVPLVTLYYRF